MLTDPEPVGRVRKSSLSEQYFKPSTAEKSESASMAGSPPVRTGTASLPSTPTAQKHKGPHTSHFHSHQHKQRHKANHRADHLGEEHSCCDSTARTLHRDQHYRIQVLFPEGKAFFRTDEPIKGRIVLEAIESIDTCGIYLQIEGWERVKFRQRASMNEDSLANDALEDDVDMAANATVSTAIPTRLPISQPHFLQSALLSMTTCVTRHRQAVPAGNQAAFEFVVKLPHSKLPSSLRFASGGNNNRYFAEIIYELTVQIFRPAASALTLTVPLQLRTNMQDTLSYVNELRLQPFIEQKLVTTHSWCCWRGKEVMIHANWARSTVSCKEPLYVKLESLSLPSSSNVRVKLVQELIFNVNAQHFRLVTPLVKVKFSKTEPKPIEMCLLDPVPPTTVTAAIQCRYFLVFEVAVPWHEDVMLSSEIAIN